MNEIYFDNAATTKTDQNIIIDKLNWIEKNFANPSSLHKKGTEVMEEIVCIKKTIAKYLSVSKEEIYFTSGGTESNNMAIFGLKNKKIIATLNQHPSIIEPLKILKQKNEVVFLKTNQGILDENELKNLIDEKTDLVCLSHVNNETGIINDIKKIGNIIKKKNPKTLFHVDGVQGFGKISLNLTESKVDSYSSSLHKIHGLKGIGIIYIKKGTNLAPLFYGGNQQNKFRPGTENIFSIITSGEIVKNAFENIDTNYKKICTLRNKFLENLKEIPDIVVNSDFKICSPYILNVSFLGLKGEIILNSLSEKNIFVSTGSACSGKSGSENLFNHNFGKDRYNSAIRFSFSKNNSIEEVNKSSEILRSEIKNLRDLVIKK